MPVTRKPLPRAAFTPFRSSISNKSAWSDNRQGNGGGFALVKTGSRINAWRFDDLEPSGRSGDPAREQPAAPRDWRVRAERPQEEPLFQTCAEADRCAGSG